MGLTQAQKSMIEKARAGGGSEQGVTLSDAACAYLVNVIVLDLGLGNDFPELASATSSFFEAADLASQGLTGVAFYPLMDRLVSLNKDADTFFACLASLHKRRLKYERILQTQPIPTIEQVGPRGLLQFGTMGSRALAGLLFWRKWFFDIDNRAGQETGYLFEPIIAHAIGGVPFGSRGSPIRRAGDSSKGRQVDCVRENKAYEFKIRVTIASSGQGRWQEELDFPEDCKASGYTPVLIVLDATPNPKLQQLEQRFLFYGGEIHTGPQAWAHLDSAAGPTMALFLEKYVRIPMQAILDESSSQLPSFLAEMDETGITLTIGAESYHIKREFAANAELAPEHPDDISDEIVGP